VKTRMQIETGKAKFGLVGTFKNIIAKEGERDFTLVCSL
jgi:hypothetical protein